MRAVSTLLVLTALVGGCAAPKPVKVVLGEACERCRRPIVEDRLVAEHIGANGIAQKFRTIHCMSTWLGQHPDAARDYLFVTNYAVKGGWIRAERASFVRVIVSPNTMERDFIAFADPAQAAEAARSHNSQVVGWDDVVQLGRTEPLGGD